MNKPKIRFKGFTDDWEKRKVGELYKNIRNAFVGIASPYYVSDGHFYLESNNVKDGQINHNTEVFINDEFYMKQKDKWLHTGDMVMVQSGHVGHSAVIPQKLNNTAAHALIMFSNPSEIFDPYFLNFQYQTEKSKKKITDITKGNTIKHILSSDIKSFVIDIPCYNEQTVISSFFSNLDNLITLHQRKCEETKTLKKYMLQKMFPQDGMNVPEIRFSGFTDPWEQRKYGELCSIITKQTGFDYTATIKKSLVQEVTDETLPYLQTKNFTGTSINYATDYFIPKSVAKNFPKINLDEKCVLFSIVGASVGNIGLFPGDKHCFLSGAICVSKFIDNTDSDYLYHFMCSEGGQSQIRTCTKGGAQATVTIEDIRNFDVEIPQKQERDKIGEYFTDLDNLITLHQRKCDELKSIKNICYKICLFLKINLNFKNITYIN